MKKEDLSNSNKYNELYYYLSKDARFYTMKSPFKDKFFSLFKAPIIKDIDNNIKIIIDYFDSIGMNHKRSVFLTSLLLDSWNSSSESVEEKFWALTNGFLPDRIELYNLNRNNFKYYLSDFDYFLLHPINNFFAFWINDKITLKYMLQSPLLVNRAMGLKLDLMPEYYLYIENDGHYSYLMDSPISIEKDDKYLLALLKEKSLLALKPSNGAGGKGFIKLFYDSKEDCIFCNDKEMPLSEWTAFENSLNGYIVTEYILQHKALAKVWPESACTLRVIASKKQTDGYNGGDINVFVSYARFGTKLSHGASNLSSGGIGIPFDFNTGIFGRYFYRYKKFAQGGEYKYEKHPDSGVELFNKKLPHWEMVRDAVYALCNHFSSLEYFGFDIIITDNGIKICEINTHPSMDYEQVLCGPVFKNKETSEFFLEKISKKIQMVEI